MQAPAKHGGGGGRPIGRPPVRNLGPSPDQPPLNQSPAHADIHIATKDEGGIVMTEPETLMEHFDQENHDGSGDFAYPESPVGPTAQSVAEQLNSLLLSADGAARRIVQEAETRAREQLAEADHRIRWMEAEAARLASWSKQTEQMLQALSSAVGEFRRDVEAVPHRISEALNPLASHVPVLVRQMEELMGALSPPPSNGIVHDQPAEAGWNEGWDQPGNGAA